MDGTNLPSAAAAATSFAELEREIRQIDIDAETIQLTYHLRKFAELFQARIADDQTLSELFSHLNRAALRDSKFAVNMAAVFASRQLDDLVIKETKLRNAMLTILQQNFQGIEDLKREGLSRFYNSITLLGEYYNRKKFVNGKRILILGQSLLLLLTTELENEIKKCDEVAGYTIDPEFAKVILTQVTLNGGEAKQEHKQEIDDLNYSIRKCLINVDSMTSKTKAFLLMALDLFYTNFNLSTKLLEKLYGKYLFEPDEDTSTKQSKDNKAELTEVRAIPEQQAAKPSTGNGSGAAGSSKTAPKKVTEKTDSTRRNRHAKHASAKPRRKEDNSDSAVIIPACKSPNTPPKKSPQTRRPPLNHTTPPKKDQRPKAQVQSSPQKSSLQRRTPPEKLKPATPDATPSPKPCNSSSVLKQNCKGSAKSSTSPVNITNSSEPALKLQMPATTVQHEDNVENLAWDDLTLEDESPQKVNPHTKSFLSFLAQK